MELKFSVTEWSSLALLNLFQLGPTTVATTDLAALGLMHISEV